MSDEVDRLREEIAQVRHFREDADANADAWRELAEILTLQLAYLRTENGVAVYHTGGLSVLEEAFARLGWSDPHRVTLPGP